MPLYSFNHDRAVSPCDSEIGASRLSRELGADLPGGLP
jgi:hypothetical protein